LTNYDRGARAEREARDFLEEAGWLVIRSAGSKGAFDLVAIGGWGTRLIQVKNRPATKVEIRELEQAARSVPESVRVEMWVRQGARKFAVQTIRAERRPQLTGREARNG